MKSNNPLPFTVEIPIESTREVKITEVATARSGGHLPVGNGKALIMLDAPDSLIDHQANAKIVYDFIISTFPSGTTSALCQLLKAKYAQGE